MGILKFLGAVIGLLIAAAIVVPLALLAGLFVWLKLTEDADEELRIEDGLIDLEPVLRDTVVPALPFQPVCRPDCPGLCSECGKPLAEDPDHQHDLIDPRWAALSAMTEQPSTPTEKRT